MVLRMLKKLFHRDSRVHIHPRNNGSEPIAGQHLYETLRERNLAFHVKVGVPKINIRTKLRQQLLGRTKVLILSSWFWLV